MYIFFDKITGNILDITYPATDPSGVYYNLSLEEIAGEDIGYKNYPDATGNETNISEISLPAPTWEEVEQEKTQFMETWLSKVGSLIALNDTETVAAQSALQTHYASVKAVASGVSTPTASIETIRSADAAISTATKLEAVFDTDISYPYKTKGDFTYEGSSSSPADGTYTAFGDPTWFTVNDPQEPGGNWASGNGQHIYYHNDFDFENGDGYVIFFYEADSDYYDPGEGIWALELVEGTFFEDEAEDGSRAPMDINSTITSSLIPLTTGWSDGTLTAN